MTNKEFKELKRYPNGDIVDMEINCISLSDTQISKLTEDDWSRYEDNQEELNYMLDDLYSNWS